MELEQALGKLEKDREFNRWKKSKTDSYFSYAFRMLMDSEENNWQIGYYDKTADKITTFVVGDNSVEMNPEEEVFKKESMEVLPIDKKNVKLGLNNIVDAAKSFQHKKYPHDMPVKIIAILQNLENLGNVWNLTFVTAAFNTLNMKINAENGKIVEHKLSSILSFKKDEGK